MKHSTNSLTDSLGQLEDTVAPYFTKKAPFQLPDGVVNFIVTVMPWFMLVGVIVSIPTILGAVGLGSLVTPFAWMGSVNIGQYWLATIFSLITLVIQAFAIPRLLKREKMGWNLVFYSTLVTLVYGIFYQSMFGALLSLLISWYILFQVRKEYK